MTEIKVLSRTQRIIVDSPTSIRVVNAGPIGPPGLGGGGGSGGGSFEFEQNVPANPWTVPHDLGYLPAVTVLDDSGNEIKVGVNHVDENTVVVSFSQPTTGKVSCT